MRYLCIVLAIVVFALATAAGFEVGRTANVFLQSFNSYNPKVIFALCIAGGAGIGLLGASGFIMTGVLSARVQKLERKLRKLNRAKNDEA